MSSLIRQSHATNDQPLWLATSGGTIDGGLTVDGNIICEGSLIADNDILLRTGFPRTTTSRLASNPAGTLYLQGAFINFAQVGSIGNTTVTTSATGANLDVLDVGGTTRTINFVLSSYADATGAPSPVAANVAQSGKATIKNGSTSVTINTTRIAASSIVMIMGRNAAVAGPGNGPALGNLTVPSSLVVPAISFTVQLVDSTTGIILAAANGDVNFDWVILNN